jgi:LuxR family maltose regulon positive regulatory protein
MSHPQSRMNLLSTKLRPPPVREKRVARKHLLHMLDAAVNQKITLICAPAGYGKTTLLSQWIDHRAELVAWISLDHGDNDLAQFYSYFLAAIQNIDSTIGALISEMLQPPQPLPASKVWIALINDLAASEKNFVVVLDDYQEVESTAVHEALDYFIEHMPDNVHLILATRADPPLPLPRLRTRHHLTELRQNDLRFRTEESIAFLNDIMGLELSVEDVIALETRTEGWIAALQMAALSLKGHRPHLTTHSAFIQSFAGSHRFILDYLVEEVLEQQPPALQEFLVKTSILERLNGSLCEAILEEKETIKVELWDRLQTTKRLITSSQSILEYLDAANLFIIPLDDERQWYRYHRLFSDLLRKRLWQTFSDLVPVLHRRASSWHAQQGLMTEAIEHALAAQDYERAASLIEDNVEAALMRSEVTTFLNWVERLPDEWVRSRPKLCFFHAWVLLMSGSSLDIVEQRLQNIASIQDSSVLTGTMAGRMDVLRAYYMIFQADIHRAAALCRQALEHLPESDMFLRGIATWILSLARLADGDIQDSEQILKEVARLSQEIGNQLVAVGALRDQAKLQMRQGRLHQARGTLKQALQLAADPQGQRLPIASEALIGLGELEREWNNLETAADYLIESIELAKQWSELASFDAYFPLARIRLAQGDVEGAHEAIESAWQIARKSKATELDDLIAGLQKANLSVIQGDLASAMRWAEKRGLVPGISSEPCAETEEEQDFIGAHLRKYEHLVLARLFISQERAGEALDLLDTLLVQARQLGRIDLVIQTQVLRAMAFQLEGQDAQALDAISEALSLAEPGGFIRSFLDEGEPVVRLLRQAASHGIAPAYVTKLLAAFGGSISAESAAQPAPPAIQPLLEPLSERELEVLRLLAAGMSSPQIADELVIAVSTVRSHCKNIYGKLNVHKRWDAVQRAKELGLI